MGKRQNAKKPPAKKRISLPQIAQITQIKKEKWVQDGRIKRGFEAIFDGSLAWWTDAVSSIFTKAGSVPTGVVKPIFGYGLSGLGLRTVNKEYAVS